MIISTSGHNHNTTAHDDDHIDQLSQKPAAPLMARPVTSSITTFLRPRFTIDRQQLLPSIYYRPAPTPALDLLSTGYAVDLLSTSILNNQPQEPGYYHSQNHSRRRPMARPQNHSRRRPTARPRPAASFFSCHITEFPSRSQNQKTPTNSLNFYPIHLATTYPLVLPLQGIHLSQPGAYSRTHLNPHTFQKVFS
jgi:hypothetical protein